MFSCEADFTAAAGSKRQLQVQGGGPILNKPKPITHVTYANLSRIS